PEAVRAENVVVTGHPRADEVGHHVVPVARGDVGAARVAQLAGDVGLAVVGGGLEQALALDLQRLTAQVAPARHGPDTGAHSPVLGEDLAGVQRPRHPDTGGEQLHPRAVAHGPPGPEASSRTHGPSPSDGAMRWMPLRMPSTSTSSGSAGWCIGSLYTVR